MAKTKKKVIVRRAKGGFGSLKVMAKKAAKGAVYGIAASTLAPTLLQSLQNLNVGGQSINLNIDPQLIKLGAAYYGGGIEGVIGSMVLTGNTGGAQQGSQQGANF